MALDPAAIEEAEDFALCLNDLVPDGSTIAQTVAYLLTQEGVVNECLKEIIIACSSQLDPDDIKSMIVSCIEGENSPITKDFLAEVIQKG